MIRSLLAIHLLVALRGSASREERDEEDDQRMAQRHRASNRKGCKPYMCLPAPGSAALWAAWFGRTNSKHKRVQEASDFFC